LDTLRQVLENQPVPIRLLNAQVDPDLETICLKCLEKDPAHRYQSARLLAEDLECYLAGDPISARSPNLLDRMAWLLKHSQYDVQFQAYSLMLFGFALIMLLAETGKFAASQTKPTLLVHILIEVARVGSIASLLLWLRPSGLQPTSMAERLMWTLWIGYVLTLYVLGICHLMLKGGWAADQELRLYPPMAAITGMAFFVLGCSYWGWCYAFGLAFHVLALLMVLDLRWSPLEFGSLWAVALMVIGMRLRGLGAAAQAPGKTTVARACPAPLSSAAAATVSQALLAAEHSTGKRAKS
jgi:hypothetical protein